MSGAASSTLNWRPLRGVDQRQLHEARLQAHHAVQWLARAARAYIPAQGDDSHTSLHWDPAFDELATQPFGRQMRLGLRITTLTLVLHGAVGSAGVQTLALSGHSDAQARAWLGEQLAGRGLDQSALDAPAPYEIPPHPVARGAAYDAAGSATALTELAAWYANAAVVLERVRAQLSERRLSPSPLRCWPHHFDLATSATVRTRSAGTTASVGAGLSPGDQHYDEPYFYVSIYPHLPPSRLPSCPTPGHWHTRDFTAAVATAHAIAAANGPPAAADAFLHDAAAIAVKLLAEAP
jgi:hypothetical protein